MKNKGSRSLRIYFTLAVFLILTFALLCTALLGMLFQQVADLETLLLKRPVLMLLLLYGVSLIISTSVLSVVFAQCGVQQHHPSHDEAQQRFPAGG